MEGPFEKRLSKKPYGEKALDDWDRSVLKKGLIGLIPKLYKDFGKSLPEVIILPDTSARPLYYALAPSFERISEEKGVSKPRFYFFKSERAYPVVQYIEESRGDGTLVTEDDIRNALPEAPPEAVQEVAADALGMPARRALMQERATQILEREKRSDGSLPTIAAIDEFASGRASTAMEMRRAFGLPELPVYAVFSKGTARTEYGYQLKPEDNPDEPFEDSRAKFSYSNTVGVGVYKNAMTESKYATRVPATYGQPARDKEMLRNEMRELGTALVDKVMEEIEKED